MEFIEQCQNWNDNEEYQKTVDAITALPQDERTPELDSELARAYNNLAGEGDRDYYKKAISLLKPHEAYFENDHSWNFRIAYAYYYLDQEGMALDYFRKALECLPDDEDTLELIDDCIRRLTIPDFERNFRERTEDSWAAFAHRERELRQLLDKKDQNSVAGELTAKCKDLLAPALSDTGFELGFNGEKYELILTPEGNHAKLFQLIYFQEHAPGTVLDHWNILVGRQPSHGFGLRAFGQDISSSDVTAWVAPSGENRVNLTLLCEKLLPFLQEEQNKAWWLLSNLVDQVMGEIPAMALLDSFDVVDYPKGEPGISLEELPGKLEQMGLNLCLDPKIYLDHSYTAYEMEPDQDPDADWRLDVFAGVTRCPILVNEYLRNESAATNDFYQDGAAAGFFCYPLDHFDGGERAKDILDFREALEDAVMNTAGKDAVTFLGGASGLYCGYLDFIAWDLPAVLNAAECFFEDSPVEWANFHTFHRDADTVSLVDKSAG